MNWRAELAALLDGIADPDTGALPDKIKMYLLAAAFLVITTGLIIFQPGLTQEEYAALQAEDLNTRTDLAQAPVAARVGETRTQEPAPEVAVTRFDSGFLEDSLRTDPGFKPDPFTPVAEGTPDWFDLHALTGAVLTDFGHIVRPGDAFHQILVQAVAEGQTDAYIDALLNAAAARGAFEVPLALLTTNGRLDTETLLMALRVRGLS